jgi:hypothetical protein
MLQNRNIVLHYTMPPTVNNTTFRHRLSMQILWMAFCLDAIVLLIAATGHLTPEAKEMAFIILPVFNASGVVIVLQYYLGSSQRHDALQNPDPPPPPRAG